MPTIPQLLRLDSCFARRTEIPSASAKNPESGSPLNANEKDAQYKKNIQEYLQHLRNAVTQIPENDASKTLSRTIEECADSVEEGWVAATNLKVLSNVCELRDKMDGGDWEPIAKARTTAFQKCKNALESLDKLHHEVKSQDSGQGWVKPLIFAVASIALALVGGVLLAVIPPLGAVIIGAALSSSPLGFLWLTKAAKKEEPFLQLKNAFAGFDNEFKSQIKETLELSDKLLNSIANEYARSSMQSEIEEKIDGKLQLGTFAGIEGQFDRDFDRFVCNEHNSLFLNGISITEKYAAELNKLPQDFSARASAFEEISRSLKADFQDFCLGDNQLYGNILFVFAQSIPNCMSTAVDVALSSHCQVINPIVNKGGNRAFTIHLNHEPGQALAGTIEERITPVKTEDRENTYFMFCNDKDELVELKNHGEVTALASYHFDDKGITFSKFSVDYGTLPDDIMRLFFDQSHCQV